MSLKLKEPKNAPSFQTLMEEDFSLAVELICLTFNIRKEVSAVLKSVLFSMKKFDKRTHSVLALMVNTRLKSFHLVSPFIG